MIVLQILQEKFRNLQGGIWIGAIITMIIIIGIADLLGYDVELV